MKGMFNDLLFGLRSVFRKKSVEQVLDDDVAGDSHGVCAGFL